MNPEHEHLLYDVWLPEGDVLKYVEPLRSILVDAAVHGGANIYHQHWHQFEPWGVTGFLLLKESHISVHTWPEEGLATIDVFTCGEIDADAIVGWLREQLHPRHDRITLVTRGGSDL